MQHNIAIVVVAYNRPASLSRLLDSLSKADYSGYENIPLVISLDKCDDIASSDIARNFNWEFGKKRLILHDSLLGLKKHVISCGDLVSEYDGVIVLEDDLMVAKGFYDYANQAFEFYKNENKLAGIALYSNCYNEVAYCPFDPVDDGYDNYFMQVPCSWGQLWSRLQWQGFKKYIESFPNDYETVALPESVSFWPEQTSWKKLFYRYMISMDLYFAYPRTGLTTNFAETGSHIKNSLTIFQTSLLLSKKKMNFSFFQHSYAVYDGYFEMTAYGYMKYTGNNIDISFDLNGAKKLAEIKSQYLISCKVSSQPIFLYDTRLYPYENNILLELSSISNHSSFIFAKTESFTNESRFQRFDEDVKKYFISKDMILQKIAPVGISFFQKLKGRIKKSFCTKS